MIVRDGTEILIPIHLRSKTIDILHFTHISDDMMWKQTKQKNLWPKIREELKKKFETCETCAKHRSSKAKNHNKTSHKNIFDDFLPGQRV